METVREILAREIDPADPRFGVKKAERYVAALDAAGFAIVPRNLTQAIHRAWQESKYSMSSFDQCANDWRAMLTAAAAKEDT